MVYFRCLLKFICVLCNCFEMIEKFEGLGLAP